MNGWRNEWTGGRNCSGYYSFFRPNPISRTGGKSPDALSLSPRLALLTVATAQAQPGCLPCWPRALGPSKSRCAKKEKQRRKKKNQVKGVPGVVLGEADETMRWCWSTPVVCILQSNHFLSCPLFFFPLARSPRGHRNGQQSSVGGASGCRLASWHMFEAQC